MMICLRTFFDTAYDFSYVPNHAVRHAYDMLGEVPWQQIFQAYAGYREAMDVSTQRVTVYSLPFAKSLSELCLDQSVRHQIAEACRGGFDSAWRAFLAVMTELEETQFSPDDWGTRYAAAGQLGLLMAAMWPTLTLERLAQSSVSTLASDRICVSLLHRKDIAAPLRRLTAAGCTPAGAALRTLALHHAPAALIDIESAQSVAREVSARPCAFKRCKEYLLAHHAEQLTENLCASLVEQLDLIPYGVPPPAEARIQLALAQASSGHGRFQLSEVDYVAIVRRLDTRAAITRVQEQDLGTAMPLSLNYVRHVIIKTACDTTGDNSQDLLETGCLDIAERDAIEFIVRLEAVFDCVVGRLRYERLSIGIDELAKRVLAASAKG